MGRERSPDGPHRVIGIASLPVAGTSDIRLAVRGDAPCTCGIVTQVVVLDRAATRGDKHRPDTFLIDAVAAQYEVTAVADCRPSMGGSVSCDAATLTAADISGDSRVTSLDALRILQAAAGAIGLLRARCSCGKFL